VDALEGSRAIGRPDGFLLGTCVAEFVVGEIFVETRSDFRISRERDHAAPGGDEFGGEKRERTDVCAKIAEDHARLKVPEKRLLNDGFAVATLSGSASVWIHANP
jgi:hypothetical protein